MNMQEGGPLRGPEAMLAQAEGLEARYMSGGRSNALAALPRWARDLLWALCGAGAMGLCWLACGA